MRIFVPDKKIKQNIMTTLEFKNLQLEANQRRGLFTHWTLFFDEVSGHEAVRFSVDFVTEMDDDMVEIIPVALDKESERAIRMFFKNTENAHNVLTGFFLKTGITALERTKWWKWSVRERNAIKL